MKIVIFGLSVSSSWGNGHATLWRGLCRALVERGHEVVFFERDVPYYASHRDLHELLGGELVLYAEWSEALRRMRDHLPCADVVMVTSFCPDGVLASERALEEPRPRKVFYDLDTPVTLDSLRAGRPVAYLGARGLRDFDLVLSYTGGAALGELQARLGARRVAPLYGSVDPEVHRPAPRDSHFGASLSYLGTYAEDRQALLEMALLEPARRLPDRSFIVGGSLYPRGFPWGANVRFVHHVPPERHASFYCSSPLTLSVTRGPMALMGYCPSGRLFEAAACGAPIVSDVWQGLEEFFTPGEEILPARSTEDVLGALSLSSSQLERVGRAARERTLSEHTAARRAAQLERLLETEG